MSIQWVVTVMALGVAVVAFVTARRAARRVTQVTEMYWQLKYDHGELKARVSGPPTATAPPAPALRTRADPQQTFVPLSQVRGSAGPPKP